MALHREFRRGDFVLRTTNLRSWTAADATHLHQTIFIYNDGKLVCRGAGDFHLAAELEGAEPTWSFPPAAVPPLPDEEQSSESRRDCASPQGIPPGRFRAAHDQLTQLDRGRCDAPAPNYYSGFPISRCLSQGSPLNLTGQSLLPPKIRSR